ncbi:hypothetical protein HBJ34_027390 (plasmid) [Klebsiella pneumoniae]|uniref:hypothetical protein n=1 Tax=Klebsiella pneumoniae TaxID=573 RepID=UPI0014193752|nr:hypothetical protein [Klebsiella pneumoniae]QOQ50424.1 hypothetical protein HBJ34_027390 [Klebsiella pneumoniae]
MKKIIFLIATLSLPSLSFAMTQTHDAAVVDKLAEISSKLDVLISQGEIRENNDLLSRPTPEGACIYANKIFLDGQVYDVSGAKIKCSKGEWKDVK